MNIQKRGVSLVILVITIIVMIILAGTVVINLGESNIINTARETVDKVNLSQIQTLASTLWVDAYMNKNDADMFSEIARGLKKSNIDITKYNIDVTDDGVEVTPFDKSSWEFAYVYDQDTATWGSKILATDEQNVKGDIVVKFYKTGEKVTPNRLLFLDYDFTFPEGDAYKILIEGSGNMGQVMSEVSGQITDGFAWQYDTLLAMMGQPINPIIPYVTEIIISDDIENVGKYAILAGTGLGKVVIGEGVKTLDSGAFEICNRLTQIYMPDSIEVIGNYAFSGCSSLHNVKLPRNLKKLGVQAFNECTSLSSVEIPVGVTSIDNNVFKDCTNLSKIIYEGTIEQWQAISFGTNWNLNTGEYTIYCNNGIITKAGAVITN